MRETGTAALLVTHDLSEAFAFGDRLVVMRDGRIAANGAPVDLLARPPTRQVAALLGIENILPAQVRAVHGGCALLDLDAAGPAIQAAVAPGSDFRTGQRVT